jgi:hypothetical protein
MDEKFFFEQLADELLRRVEQLERRIGELELQLQSSRSEP